MKYSLPLPLIPSYANFRAICLWHLNPLPEVSGLIVNRNIKCSDFGKVNCSDFGNKPCSDFGNNTAVTLLQN